ncbi:MAG: ABC transporter permease [Synergistaceae bacterium]|jgi:peptide/nickel transport system permease protein|nr:ABC transporter permease [Synergistaceae bacterium]
MIRYIVKRIITLIPVVLGVTLLVFVIMQLAPGDPARQILGEAAPEEAVEKLRVEMGLRDPVLLRYVRYMTRFVQGDFGTSYIKNRSVASEIASRFPYTVKLAVVAAVLTVVLSIPLGILAAVKQNTIFDNLSMIITLIGISMPVFWLGLLLILQFSLKFRWVPVAGAQSWRSYILPAICLSFVNMSTVARTTRSSMLETIRQDYIRTALAKGVARTKVVHKHAFRNALIPTITVIGIQMSQLLGGSVLVETVFAWPGLGRLMVEAINQRDTPMVLGCVILLTIIFSVLNLIIDLCYGLVDPRIRAQYS